MPHEKNKRVGGVMDSMLASSIFVASLLSTQYQGEKKRVVSSESGECARVGRHVYPRTGQ